MVHITKADSSSKHVLSGPAFFSANAASTNCVGGGDFII